MFGCIHTLDASLPSNGFWLRLVGAMVEDGGVPGLESKSAQPWLVAMLVTPEAASWLAGSSLRLVRWLLMVGRWWWWVVGW